MISKTVPQDYPTFDRPISSIGPITDPPREREISINLSLSLDGAEKGEEEEEEEEEGGFTTVSARTRNNDETSRPRSHVDPHL